MNVIISGQNVKDISNLMDVIREYGDFTVQVHMDSLFTLREAFNKTKGTDDYIICQIDNSTFMHLTRDSSHIYNLTNSKKVTAEMAKSRKWLIVDKATAEEKVGM